MIEWSQVDLERKLIRIEDDQTKDEEARKIPLPQRLILMLKRIEPKQGRVFDTTNIPKEWTKACAAVISPAKLWILGLLAGTPPLGTPEGVIGHFSKLALNAHFSRFLRRANLQVLGVANK